MFGWSLIFVMLSKPFFHCLGLVVTSFEWCRKIFCAIFWAKSLGSSIVELTSNKPKFNNIACFSLFLDAQSSYVCATKKGPGTSLYLLHKVETIRVRHWDVASAFDLVKCQSSMENDNRTFRQWFQRINLFWIIFISQRRILQ